MSDFVESFVSNLADSATKVARKSRSQLRAHRLLKLLADKKRILVTSHMHPDPDAIASCMGVRALLKAKLKDAEVDFSLKGTVADGVNSGFVEVSQPPLVPWDDAKLSTYDAIVMLDVQPSFAYSPLPDGVAPTAVIDHHRARGRKPQCPFVDIRTEVGATASIIFSYLTEMDVDIAPNLAASLLYAIESDLAGSAGHPGELDNMALSNLTLVADPRLLYQMRYARLPREFYADFARGVNEAHQAGNLLATFIGPTEAPEMTAVVADFLLRLKGVDWVLVGALHENRFVLSLRTNDPKASAGEMMRRLLRNYGTGGGHRTKAGGFVPLDTGSPAEIERVRKTLRQRLLRVNNLPADTRFNRLVTVSSK
jgi:nanoRNase/pAp phosphatase (c-di-AMP/oligoRNAs hydrolase)